MGCTSRAPFETRLLRDGRQRPPGGDRERTSQPGGQARDAGHVCGRGWSVGVCEATGKGRVASETCRQSQGTWNFGVWGSQRSSRKGSKKGASRGPRRKPEARGTAGPGAERRAGAQGPEGPGGPGRSPRRPEALDRALSLGGSGRSPDRTGWSQRVERALGTSACGGARGRGTRPVSSSADGGRCPLYSEDFSETQIKCTCAEVNCKAQSSI